VTRSEDRHVVFSQGGYSFTAAELAEFTADELRLMFPRGILARLDHEGFKRAKQMQRLRLRRATRGGATAEATRRGWSVLK
jgi:hypothetical protein